uniref:Uncharacterized protein n=1 Tax=Chinchilla lanigera TaxID=34839 RepID=A0A8C2VW54_CHILA
MVPPVQVSPLIKRDDSILK